MYIDHFNDLNDQLKCDRKFLLRRGDDMKEI